MKAALCQPHSQHSIKPARPPSPRRAPSLISRATNFSQDAATAPHAAAGKVHDGRLSYLETLEQFSKPLAYSLKVLAGHNYAWGKTGLVPKTVLFIADLASARTLLTSELNRGVRSDWPPTFRALLGTSSVSATRDPELHDRLRHIMSPYFSAEAIQQLMPAIHSTVAKHMAGWAGEGTVSAYAAAKALTFDVLANQALGLGMDEQEVEKYAQVFKQWTDGFMPPAINLPFLPFGKGMAARRILLERVQQSLADPSLPADGLLARFRDEYGIDSDVAKDSTITLLFAGHDTTSSAITWLLYQLALHPGVVDKLREEHAAVFAKHGPELTPAAIAAMPYTAAVVKETFRTATIIPWVPRVAEKPLQMPQGGPEVPAGCPFLVAIGAIAATDPALSSGGSSQGTDSPDSFQPERWLQPELAKSPRQMPFGLGQRYCLGSHLAGAELACVLAEIARKYSLAAATNTEWREFPLKQPSNGLPCSLTPLAGGAA